MFEKLLKIQRRPKRRATCCRGAVDALVTQSVSWPLGGQHGMPWDVVLRQGAVSCISLAWCLAQPLEKRGSNVKCWQTFIILD